MKKTTPLALIAAMILALGGCEEQGPFEEAGEKIDESIENTENAIEDACEKLKEELDKEDKDC